MRRPIGRVALLGLGLGLGWYSIQCLLAYRYLPERSTAFSWAVFHVHSTLSDGLGDLDAIALAARQSDIETVFLSEHGMPHREASLVDRRIDGVRFIGGSEVGLPEGHLILTKPGRVRDYKLPPHPPDAIDEIHDWGGFATVTYPEDPKHGWNYWEDALRPDAIEIINLTSYFRAASFMQRLRWAAVYPFQSLSYLSAVTPPSFALKKWDQLLVHRPVTAIYAVNAHGGFAITDTTRVATPSYPDTFAMAALGFQRQDTLDTLRAFRRGNYFSILRGAGEPSQFEFWAESEDGQRHSMGDRLDSAAALHVAIAFSAYPHEIRLLRDGKVVGTGEALIDMTRPPTGTYRVEVRLKDHPFLAADVPWILSNPIYLQPASYGTKTSQHSNKPLADCARRVHVPLDQLRIEKDQDSEAEARMVDGVLIVDYRLAESSASAPDRWVALAYRSPQSLKQFHRVRIKATSDRPMRYWLETRHGDSSEVRSFRIDANDADSEEAVVDIPFDNGFTPNGERRTESIRQADSLFVTVNSSNSHTGFAASLAISELALCQSSTAAPPP